MLPEEKDAGMLDSGRRRLRCYLTLKRAILCLAVLILVAALFAFVFWGGLQDEIFDSCERNYQHCIKDCKDGWGSQFSKETCAYERDRCREGGGVFALLENLSELRLLNQTLL